MGFLIHGPGRTVKLYVYVPWNCKTVFLRPYRTCKTGLGFVWDLLLWIPSTRRRRKLGASADFLFLDQHLGL